MLERKRESVDGDPVNNTYALAVLASLIPQDGPRFSVEDWNALILATIATIPESEHAFLRAQLIPTN